MKTSIAFGLILLLGSAELLWGAPVSGQPTQTKTPPSPTAYAVTSQDANSRVWQQQTYQLLRSGQIVTNFNGYTELASGLNHLVNGQWVESSEQIDILPNGMAAATNGQHQAYFPGDIYQGQIEMVTPDGLQLYSRPMGLSYFDGTNIIMIAVLTNSIGQVLGANQVIYTNAFTGFAADLIYTYTKGGFEQDIVLREQPPTPESLGLNPDTACLQILTEFFTPPQPAIQSTVMPPQAGLSLTDQSLGFGNMQMIPGRAFLLGNNAQEVGARVSKQWVTLDGRQFLVEEVPVNVIVEGLATLPLPAVQPGSTVSTPPASKRLILSPERLAKNSTRPMVLSRGSAPARGLVLDYQTVNSSQTNYTFRGDTTYYISGSLSLFGTNTFEGGTVLKYATNTSVSVSFINWLGAPYRPVIFTAKDDNSVGLAISGSTGTPTNFYANPALSITTPGQTLSSFRVAFAQQAIATPSSSTFFYNGQFVNCQCGLTVSSATNLLRNVLFANVQTNFNVSYVGNIDAQNATFSGSTYLATTNYPYTSFVLSLENCILANVTNLVVAGTLNGTNNCFYNSPPFGTATNGSSSYPFQAVGAGNYYLANGCTFTNAGTTNIDSTLLASLAQKTTYPPVVYSNATVSGIWTNQVQRDTNATPNLGYHYDPIDYAIGNVTVSGTLVLTNNVSVAAFQGSIGSGTTGFYMGGTGSDQLITTGSPQVHNQICTYQDVQEQPVRWGTGSASGADLITVLGLPSPWFADELLNARFTDFDGLPGLGASYGLFNQSLIGADTMQLIMQDCRVGPGAIDCDIYAGTRTNICLNNLFDRSQIYFSDFDGDSQVVVYNNLFHNSSLSFDNENLYFTWVLEDNLFDNSTVYGGSGLAFDHNAYLNTSPLTPTNSNDILLSSFTYTNGPLGDYYQFSNSLTNKGSTTANLRGLYHYTVQTSEVVDGTNTVSIGYHYIALDTNGNPLDADGDGISDYIEDANGDGVYDSGDLSNWLDYYNGTLPELAIVSGNNQNGTTNAFLPLPLTVSVTTTNGISLNNAPITFTVTQGTALVATSTNGTTANSITVRTGTNGQAAVFVLMQSTWETFNLITATATSGTNTVQVIFTATTEQGLLLWLRGDAGVTNNSSNLISQWSDQTTNNNNATQTSSGNQPLYVTNVLNGLPVVRFNGTSTYVTLPYFMDGTTAAEEFIVLKAATNLPSTQQTLWRMGDEPSSSIAYPNTSGQIVDDFGSGSAINIGTPAQPLNQYHVYEVAAQTGSWMAWINGLLQGSFSGNYYCYWNRWNPLDLGYDQYVGHYFAGDVAEVLVFNRTLTTVERQAVNSYVNSKYGLVPTVPPTPTNLLANAISTNQISLTWNEKLNGGATQIGIERSLTNNGGFAQIAQVADTLSYVDTNLTAGTTYYYRVRAINVAQWSAYSGIANSTTPTSGGSLPFGNLLLWLKADSGLAQIGTNAPVSFWLDQSGNTNTAVQTSPGNQPLWVAGALNGLPVVRFNGTSTYVTLPYFMDGTTAAEEFIVLKAATNLPSTQQTLWRMGDEPSSSIAYPNTSGQIVDDFGSGSAINIGTPAQPLNQYHVYEVAAQTGSWMAWINGLLQGSFSGNYYCYWNRWNPLDLGYDQYVGHYFAGDVAEVLVFNRTLTTVERQAVNSYVNSKYGLVPTVPPTPTNLLANAISTNQISLTWNEKLNGGATQIGIERSLTNNGGFAQIAQVADTLSYVDTNLTAGTTYYYRVRAINVAQWSAYSGIANSTTPTSGGSLPFGNLLLWLKADSGLAQIGTNAPVSFWLDQSGNTNTAVQTSPGNQPLWVAGALNGLPVVRFNGTSTYVTLPYFMDGTTAAEEFIVLKAATNLPSTQQTLWRMGDEPSSSIAYPNTSGQIVDDFGSGSAINIGTPAQPLNQYHVYEVAAQTGSWMAWINGALQASFSANSYGYWNSSNPLDLGYDQYVGHYFAGDVAEVLVFNRTLTASERTTVYGYIGGKYILTSPPPAPTNLLATAISAGQISLTWDEVWSQMALQFAVERSTASNGTYQVVAQVLNANSFVDTSLTAGTTYYYKVQAINFTQWSPTSNIAEATTLPTGSDIPFGSLTLWLKADAGFVQGSTNTPANTWPDQSGNGNNATQSTTANQPAWVPGALGDRPVVQFNATNSQYLNLPTSINPPSAAEAFVVLKANSSIPSADRGLWTLGDSGAGAIANYPNASGSLADNFYSTSAYSFPGTPTQPLTQYNVYEASSQNGNWMAWIDGIPQFQTTNNTYGVCSQTALGISIIFADGATQRYFDGDIAEMLLFNRVLTAGERDSVGSYLFLKYGLSASTTNAAPVTAPTNLITTGLSPYQLNLQWLPTSTNAYSYDVERKLGTSGTYQVIGTVSSYVSNYVDTTACPTNTYYYQIKAHNLFGDANSTAISPPTVSMTNWPVAVLQYSTNLLGAQAADADGTVSNVAFFANNQLIGITTSAPYTNYWIPIINRQTALSALATDNQGNSQFSAAVIAYLDSNGDGIPDYLQVMQGNDPLNPWTPPAPDTNGPPIITLLIPTNAVIVP